MGLSTDCFIKTLLSAALCGSCELATIKTGNFIESFLSINEVVELKILIF